MKKNMRSVPTNRGWMAAVTFAEAGEWDTAREMIPTGPKADRGLSFLARSFMAAAFAEAGLPEEAVRLAAPRAGKRPEADFITILGLEGTRLTYGVLALETRQ